MSINSISTYGGINTEFNANLAKVASDIRDEISDGYTKAHPRSVLNSTHGQFALINRNRISAEAVDKAINHKINDDFNDYMESF